MNLRFSALDADLMSTLHQEDGDPTWHLHIGCLRSEMGEARLDEIIAWFETRDVRLVEGNSNESFHHYDHVFRDPDLAFEYRMTWM